MGRTALAATAGCDDENEEDCSDDCDDCSDTLEECSAEPFDFPSSDIKMNVTRSDISHQNMMSLIDLQTAEGHFKEDSLIEKVVGKSLEILKKEAKDDNICMKVWITALVIAYFEENYEEQKIVGYDHCKGQGAS